jgi:hypothetical protein
MLKDFKQESMTDIPPSLPDVLTSSKLAAQEQADVLNCSKVAMRDEQPKYKQYEKEMIENRYNPNIREEVYINQNMTTNFTTRPVNTSEYYIPPQKLKEGFESSTTKDTKDPLSYGYLNTFYTELSKEKLEYFAEPLPLQGIDEPSTSSSSKTQQECSKLFDYTNNPTKEMKDLRERFKKLDKDPLEPFQKLIKDKKLKIKDSRLEKLVKDCAILSLKLKTIYNRARPYQICYKYGFPIKYLKSKHADTPSYPSSYALQAYSIAYVLGRKYDKHQKEIEQIANDIAWSRVYSGNNFESDIECSKKIVLNLKMYLESVEL